jgi:hypothetical protein
MAILLEREGVWDDIITEAKGLSQRRVRVTVQTLDEDAPALPTPEADANDVLGRLITEHRVDTGVSDLAQNHDHYLHGQDKRGR